MRLTKTLSLCCLGALLSTAAAAEEDPRYYLGFDFGFNFNLMNDDRFEGAATSFALYFPIKGNLSGGVYHERGNLTGTEDGAQIDLNTAVYEVRITYAVWANDAQELALFLGLGHGSYTDGGAIDESSFIGDVGAKFSPIKGTAGPVNGALDIHANYRYSDIGDEALGLTEDVGDMGGFQIGLGVGLYF